MAFEHITAHERSYVHYGRLFGKEIYITADLHQDTRGELFHHLKNETEDWFRAHIGDFRDRTWKWDFNGEFYQMLWRDSSNKAVLVHHSPYSS